METTYQVLPIPATELERIRSAGIDDFGNVVEPRLNDHPAAAPLRCCLRMADVGERIALIAYRPFTAPSPYAEVGPVFIHAEACDGYSERDRFPRGYAHRRMVLRSYDKDGRIAGAEFVDGKDADAAIEAELARPEIAFLHFRAETYGCYQFAVERC